MKKRFLTLLLALALLCSLTLPAAALQTQPVEVGSALELAQAMAAPASPRRGLFRARTAAAEPTRVIAFTKALADTCGADRVLHLAAWQEYVLEFSDVQTAQHALAQLRTDPNVTDCFLDETFSAEETLSGLWDETPSYSWGGRTMGFTTLCHQAQLLLPAGSSVTVAVIDTIFSPKRLSRQDVEDLRYIPTQCFRAVCRPPAMTSPTPRQTSRTSTATVRPRPGSLPISRPTRWM